MDTINDPVPDELCPHVERGSAVMTGGWYFAARVPPVAVGMCHECVVWCKQNLSTESQQLYSDYVRDQWAADDAVLNEEVIDV